MEKVSGTGSEAVVVPTTAPFNLRESKCPQETEASPKTVIATKDFLNIINSAIPAAIAGRKMVVLTNIARNAHSHFRLFAGNKQTEEVGISENSSFCPRKMPKNGENFDYFYRPMHKPLLLVPLISLFLAACGSGPAFIAERSRSEALALKELCDRSESRAPEMSRADSLMTQSASYWKQGEADKARQASEEAIGLYRISLASDSKTRFEQELASTETALAKDKERLETYREILGEMKTMRKP